MASLAGVTDAAKRALAASRVREVKRGPLIGTRTTRTAAGLTAGLLLAAGCSTSVFDKCIDACRHAFVDCPGVISVRSQILAAGDEPSCEAECRSVAADGGSTCKKIDAALDCWNDAPCSAFQGSYNPDGGADAGSPIGACEVKGQCGQ
jgi:hypothetical protein